MTESLFECVKNNNINDLTSLLNSGVDPNVKDRWGRTALMLASESDENLEIIQLLIENAADPNLIGGDSAMSPLMGACGMGQLEVVKLLIQNGADQTAGDDMDRNALMWAIEGNFEIVKLLIQNGADPNATAKEGWTPLLLACATDKPNLEIITFLIKNGADLNATSDDGWTPLKISKVASKTENLELQLILKEFTEETENAPVAFDVSDLEKIEAQVLKNRLISFIKRKAMVFKNEVYWKSESLTHLLEKLMEPMEGNLAAN
jgi:ankyrin repeat protein